MNVEASRESGMMWVWAHAIELRIDGIVEPMSGGNMCDREDALTIAVG